MIVLLTVPSAVTLITPVDVVNNVKAEGILFPNPAQNEITLKINESFSNIEIFDSRGRFILASKQKTIDISSLQSGIYFVKVVTETGRLFTYKFVKY